jgi:endonuclease/exonuclease/phosphatase family metal-dependent hydrolase
MKMRAIKNIIIPALLLTVSACNKKPYMPDNPPTYIELGTAENKYGLDNDGQQVLSTIKIMTYNIHGGVPPLSPGTVDLAAIARVINDANPDIVFLQEVDKNTARNGYNGDQAAELGNLTQRNVAFFSATNIGRGFYGTAILSKYPLGSIQKYLLPKGNSEEEQRVIGMALVDLPGVDSVIATVTHLQHNSDVSRLLQVREVARLVSSNNIPMVFGADLNEKPEVINFFNVFDGALTRTCAGGGCPNTFPSRNATSVIDYLAFRPSDAFSIQSHNVVVETYASDHFPVVSELKRNR